MKTFSKYAPMALLVGALLVLPSPASWADRRIQPISELPISSDPEVPNQAYGGPGVPSTVEGPADVARSPDLRAAHSEAWYRRLLRFVAAEFWGGRVR